VRYEIILQSPAEGFLNRLEKDDKIRIIEKLKDLKDNTKLGKPLTGNLTGLWSLRIEKYRAIYQVKHNELIILILKIDHRKKIYN